VTCSLIANGVDPHGLAYEDAFDAVGILLTLKRTIPPAHWLALGRPADAGELLDLFGAF
jgi:hypothetical protein